MRKSKNFFKPLISVIMNCHDGEKFLKKSIDSIISQTYKNWEIIFFDNKSRDNSSKIVKRFKDKRIRYFKSNKFLNLYNARNLAIKRAKGKYITFLDTDDLWTKDKLQTQLSFLFKNKEYKIIYSNYFFLDEIKKKKKKRFNFLLRSGSITQNLLDEYSIGILTAMIEKNIFQKNIFNKNYNIIGDFDFFIKISQKLKIGYIKKPLAFYRLHETNFSKEKVDLYFKELKNWLLRNEKNLTKLSFDTSKIKFFLFKLKIKSYLNYFGRVVQW